MTITTTTVTTTRTTIIDNRKGEHPRARRATEAPYNRRDAGQGRPLE